MRPIEAPRRRLENEEEEESASKKVGGKLVPANKPPAPKKAEGERRRGKLTVTRALSDDDERVRSVASYKRHLQRVNKGHQQQPLAPPVRAISSCPRPSRWPIWPTAWRAAPSTSSRF